MAKKSDTGLQYQSYTQEDAEQDHAESEAARPSKYLKIKPGKNVFRIVPGRPGKPWKRVSYKHFVDLPGGAGIASFTCPRYETKGKRKCKTCQDERKLRATGNKVDARRANRISAQRKVYMNAIDRRNEDAGPQSLEVGRGIENDMIELRRVEDVDFVDPMNGVDILIFKTGEGRDGTRYKVKEAKTSTPLHASRAVMKDWIESAPDLDSYVDLEDDDAIAAKLRGEKPDRDSDDRSSRRGKSKDEDEEDIDEVDLDDNDEDEDEDLEEIEI